MFKKLKKKYSEEEKRLALEMCITLPSHQIYVLPFSRSCLCTEVIFICFKNLLITPTSGKRKTK